MNWKLTLSFVLFLKITGIKRMSCLKGWRWQLLLNWWVQILLCPPKSSFPWNKNSSLIILAWLLPAFNKNKSFVSTVAFNYKLKFVVSPPLKFIPFICPLSGNLQASCKRKRLWKAALNVNFVWSLPWAQV